MSVRRTGNSKRRQALQAGSEPIDGVLLRGQRAVAARVLHRHGERGKDLLGGLHVERGHLSAAQLTPTRIDVDRVVGRHELAPVLEQPRDTIDGSAFLVGRQRQNQVAVGHPLFLSQADECRHERRRPAFLILRAAAVEVAVLLVEHERVHRPVFTLRRDDIEMGDEQDRLARALATITNDQVAFGLGLFLAAADNLDVHLGEARGQEPHRHPLGSDGRAPGRMRRVGLDQLLEDFATHPLVFSG